MGAVLIEEETGTDALTFLEKMPILWDNTVNLAFKKKEEIQPLQVSSDCFRYHYILYTQSYISYYFHGPQSF
jgi:hypothetical protein